MKKDEKRDCLTVLQAERRRLAAIHSSVLVALETPENLRAKEILELRDACEELSSVLKGALEKYFPAVMNKDA